MYNLCGNHRYAPAGESLSSCDAFTNQKLQREILRKREENCSRKTASESQISENCAKNEFASSQLEEFYPSKKHLGASKENVFQQMKQQCPLQEDKSNGSLRFLVGLIFSQISPPMRGKGAFR